jgi:hypothetical protein
VTEGAGSRPGAREPAAGVAWGAPAPPLRTFAAVVVLLAVAVAWKNWDVLCYAAPYFEDGYALFAEPRGAGFSLFAPMGGGYVHVLPRAFAWAAAVAPAHAVPAVFVIGCLALKAACASVVFLFLHRVAQLPVLQAALGALAAAFIQSANFTLDTLVVSSIWNLTTASFFLVLLLPALAPKRVPLALAFVLGSVWSTISSVAVVAAAAAIAAPFLLRARLGVRLAAAASPRLVLGSSALVLAAFAAYVAFGVHYSMLMEEGAGREPLSRQAWQLCVVLFERSFVEAVLGYEARAWLSAQPWRAGAVIAGAALLVAGIAAAGARAFARRRLAGAAFAAAAGVAALGLSALVAYSGRYHDGYGGTQHFYIQSHLMLVAAMWGLSRLGKWLVPVFAAAYLTTALSSLEQVRFVSVVGDVRANHSAFQAFAARHEAAPAVPVELSHPGVWAPPWSIRLPAARR